MEFYKTIRNIATVAFLAALPTICEPSCSYSGSKAYAAETRQEAKEIIQETSNLETVLEK